MARVVVEEVRGGLHGERIRDVSFVGCDINTYLSRELGPRFTAYRKLWAAAEQTELIPDFPLFLQVETVDGCNLKCRMCFRRQQPQTPHRRMGAELFRQIISEARAGACPSMCLNGNNEPLLDRLLPERIAMARDAGVIDLRINTNAMLLTDDMSRSLISSGLTRLSVSIDAASPESYSRIRTGGNLERVIGNVLHFLALRKALGSKLPVLRMTFVVLNENRHEMDAFVRFWADKADYVSFQRYVPHTPEDGRRNPAQPDEEIEPRAGKRCSQPFERLVVDVEGNVFPCCSPLGSRLQLGSLRNASLQALWASAMEKRLRRCMQSSNTIDEPVCAVCLGQSRPKP
jgi:radical SAM protein with 4Fe4S-binding SPASM domain